MNGLWVMGLGFDGQWLVGVWVALDVGVVGFGCCMGGLNWWMFRVVGFWVLVWISVWPDRWGWQQFGLLVGVWVALGCDLEVMGFNFGSVGWDLGGGGGLVQFWSVVGGGGA